LPSSINKTRFTSISPPTSSWAGPRSRPGFPSRRRSGRCTERSLPCRLPQRGSSPSWSAQYRAELSRREDLLRLLDGLQRREPVTFVHDAADTVRSNAAVLRDVLAERSAMRARH